MPVADAAERDGIQFRTAKIKLGIGVPGRRQADGAATSEAAKRIFMEELLSWEGCQGSGGKIPTPVFRPAGNDKGEESEDRPGMTKEGSQRTGQE